ncbi:unnamed protein product [Cyclocybe aegerita]|uniref:Uncharacterized protein n=1 Tax=Cyclocybe aegerita TaxID=1973307 RepID=A0A8S0WDI9_CYCAE|nr:unnamed protein product [Cyclocybe aegerita]
MSAYYPSQAGYATAQPVVYPASAGYAQPGYGVPMAASYAQPAGGVMMPPVVSSAVAAPVVMQPSYGGHYHHHSFGARLRRFFGLAPSNGIRYKSDRSTWGFMGYSRRPRYIDARTGGEVDRQGRPVYRV